VVVEPFFKLQTTKHTYVQHDVLFHAQTASDVEAEAACVSKTATVIAMPPSAGVADKPELLVHHRPMKAGYIRCIKKEWRFTRRKERARIS
jgi:hypothetical protein